MVCHETYKDENNNWLSPEEVESKDGKKYTRETDTLDTFVDSAWYCVRCCSGGEGGYGFNAEETNYWRPVE